MLTSPYGWHALHAPGTNGSCARPAALLVPSKDVGVGGIVQVAESEILGQKAQAGSARVFYFYVLAAVSKPGGL